MDKVVTYAFEWWNWGVHKLVELSEEYQIGEHVIHYKYAAIILALLGLLCIFICMAFLTLSAMGVVPAYSWWLSVTCFRIASLSIVPWFLYEQFYQEVRLDYYSLNALYAITVTWVMGLVSMGIFIVSSLFKYVVDICCPIDKMAK